MNRIKLTNGGYVLIDPQDYDFLSQFSWRAKRTHGTKNKVSVVRDILLKNGTKITDRMHRLITEADKDQIVYHINGNGLDNRRKNLQLRTTNSWTTRPSGFIGVHQIKSNLWSVEITYAGNTYQLGTVNDPLEGAKIYDNAARAFYGNQARVNLLPYNPDKVAA